MTALWYLKNETSRNQEIKVALHPTLLIREERSSDWITYQRPGQEIALRTASTRLLGAGQVVRSMLTIDINANLEPIFADPGVYWIKAIFAEIESKPQRIEVRELQEKDEKAFNYAKEQRLYWFFASDSVKNSSRFDKTEPISQSAEQLKYLVENYPRSVYADWSKLGILLVKSLEATNAVRRKQGELYREISQTQKEILVKLQDEYKLLAPTLPSPLKEEAYFEAAIIATTLDNSPSAKTYLAEVLQNADEAASTIFEARFELHEWRTKLRKPPTPMYNAYTATIAELESQLYDVKGFIKEHSKDGDPWFMARRGIAQAFMRGEIGYEEANRRQAEALPKPCVCILKNREM